MQLFTDASDHDGWVRQMALRPLVSCTTANEHCREGIVCHCYGCGCMGHLTAVAENSIPL